MQASSLAARWSARLGGAALALLAIGPLLNQNGVTAPMGGFIVFAVGLLAGVIALAFALIGVARTSAKSGRSGRPQAFVGLACGVAVIAVLAFARSGGGGDAPPINDITTDIADPPEFVSVLEIEANVGRDMSYPGQEFADQQVAAYPDLAPIEIAKPQAQAFTDVASAAKALGWVIVSAHPGRGHLEATQTTEIFQFVDDIVVRVRAQGSGSVVDVRSKSRDGRGDIGANAARIRALRSALGR